MKNTLPTFILRLQAMIIVFVASTTLTVAHAYADEAANNAIGLTQMHALDLERLKYLLKNNKILEVAVDMKKNDPKYARANEFCNAQVKALREDGSGLSIPKPQYVFRGENAENELADFVVDASLPDGKLGQLCEIHFSPRRKKYLLDPPGISRESEIYQYSGSETYNTVIYSRRVITRTQAVKVMGYVAYFPSKRACGGLRGHNYEPFIPTESLKDPTRWIDGISDLYSWRGEDVFYKVNETEINPHIRVLLFQPQYNFTSRGWFTDTESEAFVDDPNFAEAFGYQCRIELTLPAFLKKK
jgi:hypothetical protein